VTTLAAAFGAPPGAFLALTLVLFGAAALATGRALAQDWRPARRLPLWALLLGLGDRFLLYALFDGELTSASGYAIAVAVLWLDAWIAYRFGLARLMVRQYPWLYERAGPFAWRPRR
jgi:hypothetical protein